MGSLGCEGGIEEARCALMRQSGGQLCSNTSEKLPKDPGKRGGEVHQARGCGKGGQLTARTDVKTRLALAAARGGAAPAVSRARPGSTAGAEIMRAASLAHQQRRQICKNRHHCRNRQTCVLYRAAPLAVARPGPVLPLALLILVSIFVPLRVLRCANRGFFGREGNPTTLGPRTRLSELIKKQHCTVYT